MYPGDDKTPLVARIASRQDVTCERSTTAKRRESSSPSKEVDRRCRGEKGTS
jgi:hypothetical protein